MPYCPHCGALVADNTTVCKNCGASLQLQQVGASQSSQSPQPAVSKPFQSGELSQRLENALKRTELLSYAAIGLAVVILIVIIISFAS